MLCWTTDVMLNREDKELRKAWNYLFHLKIFNKLWVEKERWKTYFERAIENKVNETNSNPLNKNEEDERSFPLFEWEPELEFSRRKDFILDSQEYLYWLETFKLKIKFAEASIKKLKKNLIPKKRKPKNWNINREIRKEFNKIKPEILKSISEMRKRMILIKKQLLDNNKEFREHYKLNKTTKLWWVNFFQHQKKLENKLFFSESFEEILFFLNIEWGKLTNKNYCTKLVFKSCISKYICLIVEAKKNSWTTRNSKYFCLNTFNVKKQEELAEKLKLCNNQNFGVEVERDVRIAKINERVLKQVRKVERFILPEKIFNFALYFSPLFILTINFLFLTMFSLLRD